MNCNWKKSVIYLIYLKFYFFIFKKCLLEKFKNLFCNQYTAVPFLYLKHPLLHFNHNKSATSVKIEKEICKNCKNTISKNYKSIKNHNLRLIFWWTLQTNWPKIHFANCCFLKFAACVTYLLYIEKQIKINRLIYWQ